MHDNRQPTDLRRIKYSDMPAFLRASMTVGGIDEPVVLVTLHWFEVRDCGGYKCAEKQVEVLIVGMN